MKSKIFVLHYNALTDRKEYLLKEFSKYNFENFEFIENYTTDEIKESHEKEILTQTFDRSLPLVQLNQYTYYSGAGLNISISEYSLYLKHKYCFEWLKNSDNTHIIIFEDDIEIDEINLEEFLNKNLEEFLNDQTVDALMLGGIDDINFISKNIVKDKSIHCFENQLTRTTHAMIFKKEKIDIILNELELVNLPIDFKLNEIFVKHSFNVAWSEPCIFQNKKFKSSLR